MSTPRRGKDKPCNKCQQMIYLEEDPANNRWVAKNPNGSPHLCHGNGPSAASWKSPPAKPPPAPGPAGPRNDVVLVSALSIEVKNQISQIVEASVRKVMKEVYGAET